MPDCENCERGSGVTTVAVVCLLLGCVLGGATVYILPMILQFLRGF